MDFWQPLYQTDSSPTQVCPVLATPWPSAKSTLHKYSILSSCTSVGCMIINPWLNQGRSWPLLAGVHVYYIYSKFAGWKFKEWSFNYGRGLYSLHRAPQINVPIRGTLPFVVIILANDANEICSDTEIVSSLPGIEHGASSIRGKYTNHWATLVSARASDATGPRFDSWQGDEIGEQTCSIGIICRDECHKVHLTYNLLSLLISFSHLVHCLICL